MIRKLPRLRRLIMLLLGFLLFFIAFFGTRAVLKVRTAGQTP